ncbi:hypothetical protein BS78_05G211300 [Paspalum vaginatum]|nr:hypothetical protein BS78_05G211300 [Paspalum vaginatum]
MAGKISMIIILVDLDCYKCYNKMRKILCQLQYQERIRTISFDDKSKTITIVGPFDPQRLVCKIRCKGGKIRCLGELFTSSHHNPLISGSTQAL